MHDPVIATASDADYRLSSYDYRLPSHLIAQAPAAERDQARLLVQDCRTDRREHLRFPDILRFLHSGDLLAVNDTRVFPARLQGRKETGGRVELLLLEYPKDAETSSRRQAVVNALLKCSKRPQPGSRLFFGTELTGRIEELLPAGKVRITLEFQEPPEAVFSKLGRVPLPPYIKRPHGEAPDDRKRYQTLYARENGAVAAPTAGLHFSTELLDRIRKQGIAIVPITLAVGYGTFSPVRTSDIRKHPLHKEYIRISRHTAEQINRTRTCGGRIWAVGTTTVRALESAASLDGRVEAVEGWCDHYIFPGYRFRAVDNLITNFHLPKSSLLFLVAALCGRERLLDSYAEAVLRQYRFYSYGDAMAVITR